MRRPSIVFDPIGRSKGKRRSQLGVRVAQDRIGRNRAEHCGTNDVGKRAALDVGAPHSTGIATNSNFACAERHKVLRRNDEGVVARRRRQVAGGLPRSAKNSWCVLATEPTARGGESPRLSRGLIIESYVPTWTRHRGPYSRRCASSEARRGLHDASHEQRASLGNRPADKSSAIRVANGGARAV